MALYYNGEKIASVEETECSITLGPSMPSGFPIPTIIRRGSIVVINFGIQIPSGTYYDSTVLWKVEPKPPKSFYGSIRYGSNYVNIVVNNKGEVKFNTQQSGNSWAVGHTLYLV